MARSAWDRLAEALGMKREMNWDAANKRRQMQQNGSMDRRAQQGPMPYFRPAGAGRQTPQGQGMNASPNAVGQIPQGRDVQGQGNPLYAPPRPRSPLATPPNSPQSRGLGQDMGTGELGHDQEPGQGR